MTDVDAVDTVDDLGEPRVEEGSASVRRRLAGAVIVTVVCLAAGAATTLLVWVALGSPAFPVAGTAGLVLTLSAFLGALAGTLYVGAPLADDYVAGRLDEVRA